MVRKNNPHVDMFMRPIAEGNIVAGPQSSTSIDLYRVEKLTPVMVRLVSLTAKRPVSKYKYGSELIIVEEELVSFKFLTD